MLRSLACAVMLALAACASAARADAPRALPASYPEGPIWRDGALYFAEMGADRVTVWRDGAARPFFTQAGCGPTALAPYGEGFLVLCHIGARIIAVDAAGHALRSWDRDARGSQLMDPNDAFADGRGGVFFSDPGVFSRNTRPHGKLMHLRADGVLEQAASGLWYPNGVYVDAAHARLYVSEHMARRVLRYAIGADGALGPPEVFIDVASLSLPERYRVPYPETGPDGLEMAPDGSFYVALYGGGRIMHFTAQGRYLGSLETPARYVTNIAFDAAGRYATTGAFDNLEPPFPGEVRFYELSR